MKKFLNTEFEHKARKRFGQNFLIDHQIISNIARTVAAQKDDVLVEIGPGKGAITELLAEATDHLRVIELDRDLVPWLKVKFEKHPDFQLFQADALKFDFAQLVQAGQRFRVVGNLPYNISTPLIFHLLSYANKIHDMHFMLQKEVVKRMAAQPGESAYGRLGIMVQYFCKVDDLFDVPPESFDPAPKVDSAIVRLIPYQELPYKANHFPTLEKLVNFAFQQRRKTLRNSLKQWVSADQMESFPVDLSLRPEEISLPEYVAMSNALGEI
jgi:16S rRNA (adenine1518-N6/adenine1519-N6)-dimethyltransferase